jgi:hypothetical protein
LDLCLKKELSNVRVVMRARVKLRRPRRVNSFAKKYVTFARANMAPLRPGKPLPLDSQKPGEPALN